MAPTVVVSVTSLGEEARSAGLAESWSVNPSADVVTVETGSATLGVGPPTRSAILGSGASHLTALSRPSGGHNGGVSDSRWRRRRGVVHTPRITRMGPYTPEYTNDGGVDAPVTAADNRFLVLILVALLALGILVAIVWLVVAG